MNIKQKYYNKVFSNPYNYDYSDTIDFNEYLDRYDDMRVVFDV